VTRWEKFFLLIGIFWALLAAQAWTGYNPVSLDSIVTMIIFGLTIVGFCIAGGDRSG